MSRLLLLRHAKAVWAEPGTRDFDRALDAAGLADAELIGTAMSATGYVPDRVLCSSARRARETWEAVSRRIGQAYDSASFTDQLYSSDAAGYLDIVREDDGAAEAMLVIGHNPMMEDMAFALSSNGDDTARTTLASGFPTAGLAVIRFPGGLGEARPSAGYLEAFLTPAEL